LEVAAGTTRWAGRQRGAPRANRSPPAPRRAHRRAFSIDTPHVVFEVKAQRSVLEKPLRDSLKQRLQTQARGHTPPLDELPEGWWAGAEDRARALGWPCALWLPTVPHAVP